MEEMKRRENETTMPFKLSKCSSEGEKRSRENHIPEPNNDVIMEIFHRLPLENVYSLRGVCKKWLDLIDHPVFVNSNLARSEPCLLIQLRDYATRLLKTYFMEAQRSGDVVVVQSIDINADFIITASCNGLVVVSRGLEYLVVNPLTKRSIRLPPFPKNCSLYCIRDVSLGFDPRARQYKAMLSFCDQDQEHVAITTVGLSESWRLISGGHQVYCPMHMESSVWANGAWHWLARSGEHVISLDASKEMFFHVLLPYRQQKNILLLRLVLYEDCLGVFEHVPLVKFSSQLPRQSDIWVLQDLYKSEWMKKDHVRVTLPLVGENHMMDSLKSNIVVGGNPVAFFKNRKIALLKGFQLKHAEFRRFGAHYVGENRFSLLAYNVERGVKCIVDGQELLPKSVYDVHVFAHCKSLVTWNPTPLSAA